MRKLTALLLVASMFGTTSLYAFAENSVARTNSDSYAGITLDLYQMTREQAIEEAEAQIRRGQLMTFGGTGIQVLSFLLFRPRFDWDSGEVRGSAGLYYLGLIGGLIVSTVGSYNWWAGAQERAMLRAGRFSIEPGVGPTLVSGHTLGVGLGISATVRSIE